MDHVAMQPQVDLESSTNQKQGAVLRSVVMDLVHGVVQGRNTIGGFKEAVRDRRMSGGDSIRHEYESAYEAANS